MTLRSRDPQEISALFQRLADDIDSIVNEVIELCYYMRGAVSYEEMMRRTPGERQRISSFIVKRLESQAKSMHPVY